MKRKIIIGVMGPGGGTSTKALKMAYELGQHLAKSGYITLTGGRAAGVMEAAMKGAKSADGVTIGILPDEDNKNLSKFADIPIKTGLGSARNNINVLTSDVIVAIGFGPGTASEITLAIKAGKPVILLNQSKESREFFKQFEYPKLTISKTASEALTVIKSFL